MLYYFLFCEIKRNRFYEKKSLIITTATALFLSLAHISHAQELSNHDRIVGTPVGKEANPSQLENALFRENPMGISSSDPHHHSQGTSGNASDRYIGSVAAHSMHASPQRDENNQGADNNGSGGKDRGGN